MAPLLLILSSIIATAYSSGELIILHHPPSVSFKGHDRLGEDMLKELYTATLGFTIEHDSNWQGMYITDPFDLVEAVVAVEVDGVATVNQAKGHRFPLVTDSEANTFVQVKRRIEQRFPEGGNQMIRVELGDGVEAVNDYEIFRDIKSEKSKKPAYGHLKLSVDEDREFLHEISLLNQISDKIESGIVKRDYKPDIFWFRVSRLHGLVDLHGENSSQAQEAKQLLNDAVLRLNAAFDKAYNGRVLVSVIVSDSAHTRRTRSVLETKAEGDPYSDLNVASNYDEDYPAIFNIILWFMVVFWFSLLAISLAIGNMDPGRDSIIYRMTSTRMKKDN